MASLIHATDDSATFQETDVISGNLLSNDSSDNGHLFLRAFDGASVGAKSGMNQITEIQGEYGTFFVKPDGSYTYVLSDAAKIGFTNGELLQEKVSYKISDAAAIPMSACSRSTSRASPRSRLLSTTSTASPRAAPSAATFWTTTFPATTARCSCASS